MVYVRDRTVWQYKVLTRDLPLPPSEKKLNALGKEGWDLSAVRSQGGLMRFYLKRTKE